MTDSRKWKSVMLRIDTYELLKEIAADDDRPIASILTDLVFREWEWRFARETYSSGQGQIEKDPARARVLGSKNPFLNIPDAEDSGVDR